VLLFSLPISANWQMLAKGYLKNIPTPLKPLLNKGFSHCKKNQKSAKPMGTHWQTNTATLLNFAL